VDVTWPLVGRRSEIEVLSAVLADTAAGGVVLAGEPGIG
jgi:ATP-dependent Clp protease ATP-binding subunit ClpA